MNYRWSRYGGYECSSRGDRCFSALFARMPDGRTIEDHYQIDVKGYASATLGKGRAPIHCTPEEAWTQYLALWRLWARNHPGLIRILRENADRHGGLLSDAFATSTTNQARALSEILNDPDQN